MLKLIQLNLQAASMSELHRVVFKSRSVPSSSQDDSGAQVIDILTASQRNNKMEGVTGVLAYHHGTFVQAIEGPRKAVEATFQRIQYDARHSEVELLVSQPVNSRIFPAHSMALLTFPAENETLLDKLRSCPVSSWTADSVDVLVAELRDALTLQSAAAQPSAAVQANGNGSTGLEDDLLVIPHPELRVLDEASATAVLSSDGRLIRASASYAPLFGIALEAVVGRRRQDLTIGWRDDGMSDYESLWTALRLGKRHAIEHQVQHQDGLDVWIRSIFTPLIDASGHLQQVVEIAVDISDQVRRSSEERGQIAAINAAQAVIYFTTEGTILNANSRFLEAMDYKLEEVVGRHHRMFVDPQDAGHPDYAAFWAALAVGKHQAGEFRRFARDGREVWLQATYSPILDPKGRVLKVVKYATDITRKKQRQTDFQWQITSINKSHAVITFSKDGLILDANERFLNALGYKHAQVVGRHHRMFVDPSYAHGSDYATFWQALGEGRHQSGVYRRFDSSGREVWLQATYNPVFDRNERVVKVVKYATVVTDEKLRQAEHQGQIAAIHKAQCVISFSLDGIILDANDNFLDAVGYRLSDVRGRHHRMFLEPGYADSIEYRSFWAALASGKHQSAEFKRIGKDGREIWLQATYNPIFDLNGRPFRVIKYATDVTEERMRQADLEGQLSAIYKSQGVISFDMEGNILHANTHFLEMMGYRLDEIEGRPHRMLVDPAYGASDEYKTFWDKLRCGSYNSGLYKRIGKNGREVWVQASYNPILDLKGQPFKVVKFATDVTANVAMSEAYEDAKRQAQHDPATALPNRVRLASFMTQALQAPGGRLVAFYLDLDRFKPINDRHGHQVGDWVLGEIADRLRRSLTFDQLAARIGGDEFVVAAAGFEDDEIEVLAQRLIDTVTAPIAFDAQDLRVGVSIGIAIAPLDATTPDELLRCADAALYRSKHGGGGTFNFFTNALNERLQTYRNLVEDMQQGLVNDEFFLEFQPRFDTQERVVRSVEALVRWNHPERGRISPAEFIPAAERSGLIVPLGAWVLRTACQALVAWPSIGVSVNVSPGQFQTGDLIQLVASVLLETGIEPHRLELEVTEGMLIQDAQRVRLTLDGLKDLGIKLAIDDFGTGYSSLSSLRSFPFDIIKIDRQFIDDMDRQKGGREVVQAILSLGKALGLSVTAEGVETDAQLTMLTDDECVEVQGYLLAYPMNATKIREVLEQHQPKLLACA